MRKGIFRGIRFENLYSILDIGCGRAPELSFIAENCKIRGSIVGIDVYSYHKWKDISIHNHSKINFVVASAHNLPFRPGTFDFVFLKDVLHHILKNRTKVIREAYTTVKKMGTLRVIEANRYNINPILVFKGDKSHDHFTLNQMLQIKKHFSFEEFYGFELLPSFSSSKKDIIWNFFAVFFWLLSTWSISRRILFLFVKVKEKLIGSNLTYYVISKRS